MKSKDRNTAQNPSTSLRGIRRQQLCTTCLEQLKNNNSSSVSSPPIHVTLAYKRCRCHRWFKQRSTHGGVDSDVVLHVGSKSIMRSGHMLGMDELDLTMKTTEQVSAVSMARDTTSLAEQTSSQTSAQRPFLPPIHDQYSSDKTATSNSVISMNAPSNRSLVPSVSTTHKTGGKSSTSLPVLVTRLVPVFGTRSF